MHSTSLHLSDPKLAIDGAGVLQLTWLLGNEAHLNRAREPNSTALREASMFEVRMSERAGDKLYVVLEKGDETLSELSPTL